MASVDHVGEHGGRLRQRVDQRRPLRAGLLVLQRSGHEDGDLHVRRPVGHGAAVEERGSRPAPVPGATSWGPRGRRGPRTGRAGPGWPGRPTATPRGWSRARRRSRSRSRAGRRRRPGSSSSARGAVWDTAAGLASSMRALTQLGGEPVVVDPARIPRREEVIGRTHRAMAASPVGRSRPSGNCESPEKLIPTMPILWFATHGWCATTSMAS